MNVTIICDTDLKGEEETGSQNYHDRMNKESGNVEIPSFFKNDLPMAGDLPISPREETLTYFEKKEKTIIPEDFGRLKVGASLDSISAVPQDERNSCADEVISIEESLADDEKEVGLTSVLPVHKGRNAHSSSSLFSIRPLQPIPPLWLLYTRVSQKQADGITSFDSSPIPYMEEPKDEEIALEDIDYGNSAIDVESLPLAPTQQGSSANEASIVLKRNTDEEEVKESIPVSSSDSPYQEEAAAPPTQSSRQLQHRPVPQGVNLNPLILAGVGITLSALFFWAHSAGGSK